MVELTTVAIDKERNKKLSVICQKGSLDKGEFLGEFIDALYRLIAEARPNTEKISITSWAIDLKTSTMKIGFANLVSLDGLPDFIQSFYSCQKFLEDSEINGKFPTKEELLAEGFNEADIDILLNEQKARFQKKVKP
jgi:hypothetical protein